MATSATLGTVDALVQLSFVVQGSLARHAASHDLSLAQTRLLGVLRDREPTMQELARLLELDKSSVTGLVDRAERRGLVTRAPSTDDRRAIRVAITADGRRLIAAIGEEFGADVKDMVAGISAADRKRLTTLAGEVLVGYATARGIDLSTSVSPLHTKHHA